MARLSYRKRKRMPQRDFALPSKRRGGKGGFPIEDERHARAALARASMARREGSISASEQKEIERKVHQRYPDIGRRDHRRHSRSYSRRSRR